jgi:hypothetical protein
VYYDVCHMTIDEKNDMIEQIMADHNAAIVIATASTHLEEGTIVECEVSNKDFV